MSTTLFLFQRKLKIGYGRFEEKASTSCRSKCNTKISLTANLDRAENTETFFFFEEVKETILGFSQKAL